MTGRSETEETVDETPSTRTANDQLADTIAEALLAAELVPAAHAAQLRERLAAGTAREGDWTAWIEAALDGAASEEPHGRAD